MSTFRYESTPTTALTLPEAFARLLALAGADPADVLSSLPSPERAAFDAALAVTAPGLQPLRRAAGGSLLARFLGEARFDGEPEPRYLPKAAKKELKAGDIVASSDADVWIFLDKPDGTTRVSHAHPESFEVLGESIAEWLQGEIEAIEAARRPKAKPSGQGKPAIDAVLARLVELSGGDAGPILATLTQSSKDTRWDYLKRALAALGKPWSPELLAVLEGRLLGRLLSGKPHDDDDEICEVEEDDEDLDGVHPIYVGRYPEPARKLVAQIRPTHYIASSGPEIWFILQDAKGSPSSWNFTVHHASYEGYEQLGASLEGWLAGELARAEAALSR